MSEASFFMPNWTSNIPQLQIIAKTLDTDIMVDLLGFKWNTCIDTIAIVLWQIKSKEDISETKELYYREHKDNTIHLVG